LSASNYRTIEGAELADHVGAAFPDDLRVAARDRDVVEEDVALGRAPHQRARPRVLDSLAAPPPPRAYHERRPARLARGHILTADFLGREAQRRLALLVATEVGPAAGARVRGLGILEAALRAVHMAHRGPPRIVPRSFGST